MKTFFLILALLAGVVVMTQSGKEKTEIIITKTTPYCGGANPPEEILNEARKQKIPYGEKFYIIKGGCNKIDRVIIDTLVFDSSGKRLKMLKPGCYSVINEFGFNKLTTDADKFDLVCLKALWTKPLFSFVVVKGKSETFSHNIAEQCPYNMPCHKGIIAVPL